MTLAVAKAIMETDRDIMLRTSIRRQEDMYLNQLAQNTVSYIQSIGRNYPDCGYGSNFGQWILSENPQPYGSYGNGASMRISSVRRA
jgi:ADP-ribosylglycohydrolase